MGIEIFNRYEKKFKLDIDTYKQLSERLADHLELDAFNKQNGFYTISNIYYDTPDNTLIQKSIEKPIYKEKLRLRSYGVPSKETKAYLEIKKKYDGIVNKRRTSMTVEDAARFVDSTTKPEIEDYHNTQVINEIAFLLKRYDLQPAIYIAYDRSAFFSKESRDLRITFDTNIRTRRYDLSLEAGDYGEPLIEDDTILMEIKAEKAFPVWLAQLLSEFELMPSSFSKYGYEYKKNILKGGIQSCSTISSQQHQLQPLYH